jgi:hypothetical protein
MRNKFSRLDSFPRVEGSRQPLPRDHFLRDWTEMDLVLYSHMAQRRLGNSAENARWSSGPGERTGRHKG